VAAAGLLLLAALPALAQAPPAEEPEEVFFESVDVDIANLEVFVTDADGRPIIGLGKDDFELWVDGERVEIQNFYAASTAVAAPAAEAAAATTTAEGAAPAAPVADGGLTMVILLDESNVTPGERQRALKDLADSFARGLPAGTRAMVATFTTRIEVLVPFTNDGTAIADALVSQLKRTARGSGRDLEFRRLLRQLEDSSNDVEGDPGDVLFAIRSFQSQELSALQNTLTYLEQLMRGLSGLPGRKALLYLGGGLDRAPGRSLLEAWRDKYGAAAQVPITDLDLGLLGAETAPLFERLIEHANANRVIFYAISTAGVGPGNAISAEAGGFDPGALNTASGGRGWSVARDSSYRADQSGGLALVADETGGRALIGSSQYDLVTEWIDQDAEHLYSLGFAAPPGEPGSRHDVEVRVPGRDLRLRYRRALVTTTPEQRTVDRTIAALFYGDASNPLMVRAELGEVERFRGDLVQPVLVKIPFANLALLPSSSGYSGELAIHVVAEDAEGRMSEVRSMEAPVRLPADRIQEALAGVAGYRLALAVRPGRQRIAIGVRDVLGDVTSTVLLEENIVAPGRRDRRGGR
jgi:VWFA-related protein